MLRIACACPSRDRPDDLVVMVESMIATSESATALVYIDDDQLHLYMHHCDWEGKYGKRVKFSVGKQIGPAKSCEWLISTHKEYDVYGLMTDDAIFLTPGWDRYLSDRFEEFPGRIGVVSPDHEHGPWVNFPYVSRQWLDIVGWYVYPGVFHFCWDTVLEILGEGSRIDYPNITQFGIKHFQRATVEPHHTRPDAMAFLGWCITERRGIVRKLREAISWKKEHPQ